MSDVTKVLLSDDYQEKVAEYAEALKILSDRKKEAQRVYKEAAAAIDTEAESVKNLFQEWHAEQLKEEE